MGRTLRAVMILLLVASCGGGRYSAPRDLDNACNIVKERPKYLKAFKRAERRYGVEPAVMMAMIHQESKFIGNAKTPHRYALGIIPLGRQSSAYGYSQALEGTWEDYKKDSGRRRAKRDDIDDAADFMGWYMRLTKEKLGISMNDTRNQYLAYHDGHTGYARGTYKSKSWLMAIADKVAARAHTYRAQLRNCSRR
ncbi:transglycosylase SLT domain-containing protein [Pseudooceanicola sp.]|uniref:transglycosylase SLT domain-containing protein n=1 Tax=Pseudooceanicola sp. TaxID=1914328 RepID=UPI0026042441|nr:transglycosylase SLT domain-containing protein [Pseudooceanicola sp.]MDF1854591.1 transglycosylase SLT domain-containing protein [Pseudooceanicola sp.]